MHNPFDQLAKKVGKEALDASGLTVVQHEVSRDAQHADLRHDPDPTRDAERSRLGLLGRIAAVLCLLEIYGHAPSGAEIRACVGKHFAHWDEHERKARVLNKRRKEKSLPVEPFVEPRLWIIAAAVSAPILRKLEVKTAPGWPVGVYFHGDDLYLLSHHDAPRLNAAFVTQLLGQVMASDERRPPRPAGRRASISTVMTSTVWALLSLTSCPATARLSSSASWPRGRRSRGQLRTFLCSRKTRMSVLWPSRSWYTCGT